MEPDLVCESCLPSAMPMLDGFLLRTFERGLSTVEEDDPETSEGVRVLPVTSSLGRRDEEICRSDLEPGIAEDRWDVGTVGVADP